MISSGRLPLDEQAVALRSALSCNERLLMVLDRIAGMGLPGWYLTGGAVFQTVWNVVTGRPADAGIKDFDIFYFDDRDPSWEAEDQMIQTAATLFEDLPVEVEIRNEARVHLWYEAKFGEPCAPYDSTEAAIDSFAATTCAVGIRPERAGQWRVYAPHGLADVFNLVLRPNPGPGRRQAYITKSARWQQQWPELTVLPWPD
ncbi:nucleotidyltransferase family protein [Actinoplanes sp. HUAS TT8]|uniref:nucleotidyltransferase family protein n=1 Tax=Actinoplanes sp. HUAS TT8 TaxID=3447453 RepID=UPI003F5205D6